jgi:LysM repeat protein
MVQNKGRAIMVFALILLITTTTACERSLSQAPQATPTLIPTSVFPTPLPTSMDFVEGLITQTAMAETPGTVDPNMTPSEITPETGVTATATPEVMTGSTSTATQISIISTSTPGTTSITSTPPAVGTLPTSYALQSGEFPYCIARRFNLNPDELLSLNGLADGMVFQPGLVLKIPQTGNPFPGTRAWHPHPATFVVSKADETLYGVACYYGDIDPNTIAQTNSLALSATLTVGQQITIP